MIARKTMVDKYSQDKILFKFYRSKKITVIEGGIILGDMSSLIYTFIKEKFSGKEVTLGEIKGYLQKRFNPLIELFKKNADFRPYYDINHLDPNNNNQGNDKSKWSIRSQKFDKNLKNYVRNFTIRLFAQKGYQPRHVVLGVADDTIIGVAQKLKKKYPNQTIFVYSYDLDFSLEKLKSFKDVCTDQEDSAQKHYKLNRGEMRECDFKDWNPNKIWCPFKKKIIEVINHDEKCLYFKALLKQGEEKGEYQKYKILIALNLKDVIDILHKCPKKQFFKGKLQDLLCEKYNIEKQKTEEYFKNVDQRYYEIFHYLYHDEEEGKLSIRNREYYSSGLQLLNGIDIEDYLQDKSEQINYKKICQFHQKRNQNICQLPKHPVEFEKKKQLGSFRNNPPRKESTRALTQNQSRTE